MEGNPLTEKGSSTAVTVAVVRETGKFELEEATLEAPRPDEVLVKVVAVGLCHTDLVVRDQLYPVPLPAVLGHEGAGVVEAVGSAVKKVKPGDHVAISFLACYHCRPCLDGSPASCANFNDMNFAGKRPDGSHALSLRDDRDPSDRFFGQSSFATHAIAHESNVVRVRDDAPLELVGPLGCGIQTGAGTVLRALKVTAGSTFMVTGAGAVGLSAVMAARATGARTIIAVDVVPGRLELALELGATHSINGKEADTVEEVLRITDGEGVDFALDNTGLPALILQCVESLRQKGKAGIVGASDPEALIDLPANTFMQSTKTLMGVVEGDSVPDIVVPQLLDLHMQGRFPFDKMVRFYDFDQINEAAADAASGETIKPILRMG